MSLKVSYLQHLSNLLLLTAQIKHEVIHAAVEAFCSV